MKQAIKRTQMQKKSAITVPQLLLLGGIGLFLVGGLLWLNNNQPDVLAENETDTTPETAVVGERAPNFELMGLHGEPVALSDYRGQVVLINFWATWCPPCRAEMPGINNVYEEHQAEGFTVLAVNAREDISLVNGFIGANEFSFPVLLDQTGKVETQYLVNSFPTTFVIDRDGVIQFMQSGIMTEEQLDSIVTDLLTG